MKGDLAGKNNNCLVGLIVTMQWQTGVLTARVTLHPQKARRYRYER